MRLQFAISWLRTAKGHVDNNERYRWWALYGALIAGFMHALWLWPFDYEAFLISLEHEWIWYIDLASFRCGLAFCVCFGIVGLVRSNWLGRAMSLYALWFADQYLTWFSSAAGWLWSEFTWYAFDVPEHWIHGMAPEGSVVALCFWSAYFAVIWIALRPLAKRAWTKVRVIEDWALDRWPVARRFAKPIM